MRLTRVDLLVTKALMLVVAIAFVDASLVAKMAYLGTGLAVSLVVILIDCFVPRGRPMPLVALVAMIFLWPSALYVFVVSSRRLRRKS